MSSLACVAAEVNESTSSAFLIAFQNARAAEFFQAGRRAPAGVDEGVPLQRHPEGPDSSRPGAMVILLTTLGQAGTGLAVPVERAHPLPMEAEHNETACPARAAQRARREWRSWPCVCR